MEIEEEKAESSETDPDWKEEPVLQKKVKNRYKTTKPKLTFRHVIINLFVFNCF